MSIRERKAHADQVVGRAEEIVGQAYADPAAEVHGEAVRLRGEVEEDAALLAERRLEVAVTPDPGRLEHVDPGDAGLRADVLEALMLDPLVPASIAVRVRNGRVTLTGSAAHQHQRDAAEAAARGVVGVVDVRDETRLTDSAHVPGGVRRQIRKAFVRKAKKDADRLAIGISDGTVTLGGQVCCHVQHDVAVAAAAASPDVHGVDDQLTVAASNR